MTGYCHGGHVDLAWDRYRAEAGECCEGRNSILVFDASAGGSGVLVTGELDTKDNVDVESH